MSARVGQAFLGRRTLLVVLDDPTPLRCAPEHASHLVLVVRLDSGAARVTRRSESSLRDLEENWQRLA